MLGHQVAEAFAKRRGEIVLEFGREVRILGHVGRQQVLVNRNLAVGQQQGKLRSCQALAARHALTQLLVVGQLLQIAIDNALVLEHRDEVRFGPEAIAGDRFHHAQGLVLQVVRAQHQVADLVAHVGEQLVALVELEHVALDCLVEQNLDVDFVVGAIDTGRVVDEVRVETTALHRKLDASTLRQAEVAALANDAGAQLAAIHAHQVVGQVADIGMRFDFTLDVGADAAVPEQVHGRLEQGLDQLVGRKRFFLDAQPFAHLVGQLDRLGLARKNAAAG